MRLLYHKIVGLFIAVCLLCAPSSFAESHGPKESSLSVSRSMTGVISGFKRNRILIIDDQTRRVISFIYFARDKSSYKAGERVRVYYMDRRQPVLSMTKLQILEPKDSQNLGYIMGQSK